MAQWLVIVAIIIWLAIERGLRLYGYWKLSHRIDRAFGQIQNEQAERGRMRREFRARVHTVRKRVFSLTRPTHPKEHK